MGASKSMWQGLSNIQEEKNMLSLKTKIKKKIRKMLWWDWFSWDQSIFRDHCTQTLASNWEKKTCVPTTRTQPPISVAIAMWVDTVVDFVLFCRFLLSFLLQIYLCVFVYKCILSVSLVYFCFICFCFCISFFKYYLSQ